MADCCTTAEYCIIALGSSWVAIIGAIVAIYKAHAAQQAAGVEKWTRKTK